MGGPLRSSSLPPGPVAFYAGDNGSIVLRIVLSKACTPPHTHTNSHTLFLLLCRSLQSFDIRFYAYCLVTFMRFKLN